jgi:hypothetical protein
MSRADRFLHTLKENDVGLVTYVPDNVLPRSSPARHPPALHAGLGTGRASALDG